MAFSIDMADLRERASKRVASAATLATLRPGESGDKTDETPEAGRKVATVATVARVIALVDAARWCWPNGPAMNTAELAVMEKRIYLFKRQRTGLAEAERLADRLVIRDRDADDRVMCIECKHCRSPKCPNGHPLPRDVLHRCRHCTEPDS